MTKLKTTPKEISINKPSAFTGDRRKIQEFIQECWGYLQLNKHIYDTNEAKKALKWKEAYLASLYKTKTKTNVTGQEGEDEGEFEYLLSWVSSTLSKDIFNPSTKQEQPTTSWPWSNKEREQLKMAGMTVTTDSDNLHLINYFQRGLNLAIAKKIALSDNVPTTVNGWAEKMNLCQKILLSPLRWSSNVLSTAKMQFCFIFKIFATRVFTVTSI
jgi:hypothetical protein